MKPLLFSVVASLSLLNFCFAAETENGTASLLSEDQTRNGRFVSMFQVVKFPNDPCVGSGTRNGTCFTTSECATKKGVAAGTCAAGFGVCCTFLLNCGQTASQNCTYFESGTQASGSCSATVCKLSSNICQIRLDFTNFAITGPSTLTTTTVSTLFGQVINAGATVSTASQCLTDSFSVTGSPASAVPVLCGTLTGDHIYLEASPNCNNLNFNLGSVGNGAPIATRSWQIKVTQYNCEYVNRAPAGCLQYFYGVGTGVVNSFNYYGRPAYHLANQRQSVCIRREKGMCRICYWAAMDTDIQLSGKTMPAVGNYKAISCCGYKADGKGTLYDCLIVPGASDGKTPIGMLPVSYCGRSKGLVKSDAGMIATTVCSKRTPFKISFFSDNWENTAATMGEALKNAGFKLSFAQTTC